MAHSGEILDLSRVVAIALDKHSTGGVGDKTTLVVEPIVAACGFRSARCLAGGWVSAAGTLDKMESIPGYRTNLTTEEFLHQLAQDGLVLTGQTADLAPADGKLYALRDVTGYGSIDTFDRFVGDEQENRCRSAGDRLDVKVGLGAFMQTLDEARALARLMVDIAHLADRKAVGAALGYEPALGPCGWECAGSA